MKKISTKIISFFLVIVIILPVLGTAYAVSSFTTVCPFKKQEFTHDGAHANDEIKYMLDISEYQGKVNYFKIKQLGVDSVILRLAHRYSNSGTIVEDKLFYTNIEQAIKAGLNVGIYIFSQAITQKEAEEEADYCLQRAQKYSESITMPIFMDCEFVSSNPDGRLSVAFGNGTVNKNKMTDFALAFCKKISDAGYRAGVYANASFYTNCMEPGRIYNSGYEIWYAHYTNDITKFNFWGNRFPVYSFWQYGGTNVEGICGDENTSWLRVLYNGKTGYMLAKDITFTGAMSAKVSTSSAKQYSGTSTSSSVITTIPIDSEVKIFAYIDPAVVDTNFHYVKKTAEASEQKPEKPEFEAKLISDSEIAITWKQVIGASYYEVFRYDSQTGNLFKLYQTAGTSYTDNGFNKTENPAYLVRAFNSKGEVSPYSQEDIKIVILEQKPAESTALKNPKFVLKPACREVRITWEAVENAEYYSIFSVSDNGEIKQIGQTDSLYFTTRGLTPKTYYSFLVTASGSGKTGKIDLSEAQSVFTLSSSPSIVCNARGANSLALSWESVENASYYRVFSFDTQTGKYKKLLQTQNNSCILTNLKKGCEYTLLVRSFDSEGKGSEYSADNHFLVSTLSGDFSFTLKAGLDSVLISWNKIDGVSFYRVYSYNMQTKKYVKLAETVNNSWEHKGLKSGTDYTYLVRYFADESTGNSFTASDNKSIKTLPAKPAFKLGAVDEKTINITWGKVSGASYYCVYLYNTKAKKYERLAKTTALKYSYKKAKYSGNYTFLVRAFDSKDNACKFTATDNKSIKMVIGKAIFTVSSPKKGTAKITWKKVPMASYYRVYMYSAGKYKAIAKTNSLSFNKTKLNSGKKSIFLVKPFTSSGQTMKTTVKDNKAVKIK